LGNSGPALFVGNAQIESDEDLKLQDQRKQERSTFLQDPIEWMIVQELGDHWNRYAQEPQDGPGVFKGL